MIDDAVTDRILTHILDAEGGIADVGDGAGTTRFGQTVDWLDTWLLPVPKTEADARANYKAWLHRTRLDELTGLSASVALVVIDSAVNEGQSFAVRTLQTALHVLADGELGPVTFDALAKSNMLQMAYLVLELRLEHYVGLVQGNPTRNLQYLGGWMHRLFELFMAIANPMI